MPRHLLLIAMVCTAMIPSLAAAVSPGSGSDLVVARMAAAEGGAGVPVIIPRNDDGPPAWLPRVRPRTVAVDLVVTLTHVLTGCPADSLRAEMPAPLFFCEESSLLSLCCRLTI